MIGLILTGTIYFALTIHTLLIVYALWRVWSGENEVDRLLATELVGTLGLAVVILFALEERSGLYLDVALGLGTLSFIGVVAYAKYVADRRMF